MLMFALAVFTLAGVMGMGLIVDVWRGRGHTKAYALVHGGLALLGSGLVVAEALKGDSRLYTNIGLAVVIILIGVCLSSRRALGTQAKGAALVHASLAAVCYVVLAWWVLGSGV
ncbi:hypothetical protein [Methylomagnum sp.]